MTEADKPDLIDALRNLGLLESLVIGEATASPDPRVVTDVDSRIEDACGGAHWFQEDFVPLAERHWPRLRRLSLHAPIRSRDSDDAQGVPWVLEEFELNLHRHGRLPFRQIDLLLAGCRRTGSLRRLRVREHQLTERTLVRVIEHYGSHLSHLTTATPDLFTRDDLLFPTIAAFCPALRVLHLSTPVYDLVSCLRHLLQPAAVRLRHLTLATVLAPAHCPPDLAHDVLHLVQHHPTLELVELGPGTHHVTDRARTIAFARRLADVSRNLASAGVKARLAIWPTWGP